MAVYHLIKRIDDNNPVFACENCIFAYNITIFRRFARWDNYMRIGIGSDIHRLQPGGGIKIGGILIPCEFGCVAVSDGDVLLHALVDALLGATGAGDIGERYPESRVVPGEDSSRYVREVLAELGGARVENVDCIVHLERPKLSPWKDAIRRSVAGLLGIEPGRVGVKAKTAEGLDAVGRGEAVAAQVVVLLSLSPE